MDSGLQTRSSVGGQDGFGHRLGEWLFLEGDRRLVTLGIIVAFVAAFSGLVAGGVVAVGPGSSVASVFGSGLTPGIVTLLTIALSINQLILSRVFGSPGTLTDRLDGSRGLRQRVEQLSGQSSSPNDPAAFLSLLVTTLSDRATAAVSIVEESETDSPTEVAGALADIAEYGHSIDTRVKAETPISDILGVIVGPEYAINMAAIRHLRNEYEESLPPEARAEMQAVNELLESVAVVRQFFKTLALQQDFAVSSRYLVYSGLVALLASVSMTLVYRSGSVAIVPSALTVVVPLALGIVVAPLALFAAYILRAASVAYRTVSVGPFIPPEER